MQIESPSKVLLKTADAFDLKGSLFTLIVLQLLTTDMASIVSQLQSSIKKTPNMFKNMPLVIDLQKIKQASIDFHAIVQELRNQGLIPVGVRNGSPAQHQTAQEAGLGILATAAAKEKEKPNKIIQTTVINKPIRSGQQFYAKQANLVLLAPVSHGAEVLADGYIHAYGALRGRVIAGAAGDTSSQIFCHKLEAELIAIAGFYKLLEESITAPANSILQINLEDEKINIQTISHANVENNIT